MKNLAEILEEAREKNAEELARQQGIVFGVPEMTISPEAMEAEIKYRNERRKEKARG